MHGGDAFLSGKKMKSMAGVLAKFLKVQSCMSSSKKKITLRNGQTINVGELGAAPVSLNI